MTCLLVIGRIVPLLKPPQSPHCKAGEDDHVITPHLPPVLKVILEMALHDIVRRFEGWLSMTIISKVGGGGGAGCSCAWKRVPGGLLKSLHLITAPGSVSNGPGSVTWPANRQFKNSFTTLWTQNTSFWPKIKIPSSYFTIVILNCLENSLKLQFDSYVIAVKFLTLLFFKRTWIDLIPTLMKSLSREKLYCRCLFGGESSQYHYSPHYSW